MPGRRDLVELTVPLRNRVAPTGEIIADPGRGTLTGNRGCLHGTGRDLGVSRWRSKLWICCVLDWRGRRRDPMPPRRWTMLFFLDEATALAAGHRPCAYCRRADYVSYVEAWRAGHGLAGRPRAVEMDAVLHGQRVDSRTRRQVTRAARAGDLPDGVMVRAALGAGSIGAGVGGQRPPTPRTLCSGPAGTVGLVRAGSALQPWSFAGYGPPSRLDPDATVELLTPPASVAALRAGYRPMLHPTATITEGRPPTGRPRPPTGPSA